MPLRGAEPLVGVAWAVIVPVMSPLVSGRNVIARLQLALGSRAMQGGPARVNWRGSWTESVADFELRLLMVTWREVLGAPVTCGPNCKLAGKMDSPSRSAVYAPVSGTVIVRVSGAPPASVVTGMFKAPNAGAAAGT